MEMKLINGLNNLKRNKIMKIEIKIKNFEVLLSDNQDKSLAYNFEEIKKLIGSVVENYNKIEKK